jgi:hypothetical protein
LAQWLDRYAVWPGFPFRLMGGDQRASLKGRWGSSSGAYWTRNGSEFRNGGVASSLSSILETGEIDPRYYLSRKACAGILRRAAKRGKILPAALAAALEAVASATPTE